MVSRAMWCDYFFFSSRRRHTRLQGDWSSDVCSSDLVTQLATDTEREIERFPKQSGAAAEPTLAREVSQAFDRAEAEAKALGDAYVSTEHLLLALADLKGTTARQLLSVAGVGHDDLLAALEGVAASHALTDQQPE